MLEYEEYLNYLKLDKSQKTIDHYKISGQKFLDFFSIESLEDLSKITLFDCRKFQANLAGNVSNASVNSYVRPLKVMFNWMVESGYLNESPMEKLKKLKDKKDLLPYLEEEEVLKMIHAAKKLEEKLIVAMLVSLGVRRSELINIKLEDVNENCINILGKGSKERQVYLPDDVFEMLKEYLNTRKNSNFPYLFRSKMGKSYSPESIRLKVKRIARMAGIDENRIHDISPHSFRRTFATNMVENGVDIRVIQGAMGHSSINTTMRYANLRNSAVKKAMMGQTVLS